MASENKSVDSGSHVPPQGEDQKDQSLSTGVAAIENQLLLPSSSSISTIISNENQSPKNESADTAVNKVFNTLKTDELRHSIENLDNTIQNDLQTSTGNIKTATLDATSDQSNQTQKINNYNDGDNNNANDDDGKLQKDSMNEQATEPVHDDSAENEMKMDIKQEKNIESISIQQQSNTIIPENILSPPKSETQTDEANTATSSSPASESQMSPPFNIAGVPQLQKIAGSTVISPVSPVPPDAGSCGGIKIIQPIDIIANGTIPKSGKPLMSAMTKKLSKSTRTTRQRKAKTLVAMYESEISDNKMGIKLCIKKSDSGGGGSINNIAIQNSQNSAVHSAITSTSNKAKQSRKRSRKSKTRSRIDSDDSEYETKKRKVGASNNSERQKRVAIATEPIEQSVWGSILPENVLLNIFQIIVERDGCLPTLFRLGRVCSLWRRASLSSCLWKTLDLSTFVKEKNRTELKLKWFVDNRCYSCTELNVSNWKVTDISCFLNKLVVGCPNLVGIALSGWKGFTSDHLTFLVENMKKLERIDLSSINVEVNPSKSAVGVQSLCNALQTMNSRLTHLYLAHNRLAGIPQIVTTLATYCPNLVLLDLSNVHTAATSHGILHIEKLQHACQMLKVLRVTNSHVTLSQATLQETLDSPGFPNLEELSVAALTDESRIIGDEHVQRILKTSSKLKLLDVRGCTRLTHESLIRLPAWDIKHLFLSGCSVTRDLGSGLELIASKWAHSLIEIDLAWANVQIPLDNALRALAEKGRESPLTHLNLCGSSVSEDAVKEILANCPQMNSINLASCRGLPRGVKRLMHGPTEIQELRDVLKVVMKVKLPSQNDDRQQKQEEEKKSEGDYDKSEGCQNMSGNN